MSLCVRVCVCVCDREMERERRALTLKIVPSSFFVKGSAFSVVPPQTNSFKSLLLFWSPVVLPFFRSRDEKEGHTKIINRVKDLSSSFFLFFFVPLGSQSAKATKSPPFLERDSQKKQRKKRFFLVKQTTCLSFFV